MAIRYWTSTDGDLTATASWGGATIQTGDTLVFDDSSQSVTSNLDPGITGVTWIITDKYRGTFGNSIADPVVLSALTTADTVYFRGSNCPAAYFDSTGQASTFYVYSTSNGANACVITGTGNGYVNVIGGRRVTIDSGATQKIRALGAGQTYILSGATIATLDQWNGNVESLASITAVNLHRGNFYLSGTTTNTVTTLLQYGGRSVVTGNGASVPNIKIHGGTLDCSGDSTEKTLGDAGDATQFEVYPGATCLLNNQSDTITATITNYGGKITGGSNVTITDDIPELGTGAGDGFAF